jgi:hypothetical protein
MENYNYAMRGWSCFVFLFCVCGKTNKGSRTSRPSATRTVKRGGGVKEGRTHVSPPPRPSPGLINFFF